MPTGIAWTRPCWPTFRPGSRVVRVPMLNERVSDTSGRGPAGTRARPRARRRRQLAAAGPLPQPDLYACGGRRPAARRSRLMRDEHFDAIYATGFPWTTLLVGVTCRRPPGVRSVADFRDPWVGEDLFRAERPPAAEERPLERQVVEHAAAVITVAPTMTKRMVAAYPELEPSKFVTIYNGFDPDRLRTRRRRPPTRVPDRLRRRVEGRLQPVAALRRRSTGCSAVQPAAAGRVSK